MSIIDCVVSNVAIATALAFVAAIVGRVTKKPQITHTLWLLVLVKLVTPPVVHIPVNYPVFKPVEAPVVLDTDFRSNGEVPFVVHPELEAQPEFAYLPQQTPSSTLAPNQGSAVPLMKVLAGVWIVGSLIWFFLAGTRLMRFKKVLRYGQPASEVIQAEVCTIASRYGLRNIPRVLVADAKVPPLIWSFGRRTFMVLPSGLLDKLGADERAGLLAHELAHLRRYDHWIRWFEFVVLGAYWWNPIAWWARAQIQQAEEECCDGWVLWAFPGKARLYAQTLVDTVEFLADSPERKPDIATAFNQGNSLYRRIEMIVSNKVTRRLSWTMRVVLVLFALFVVPLSLLGQGGTKKAVEEKEPPRSASSDATAANGKAIEPVTEELRRSHSELRTASRNVQGKIRVFRSETVIPEALEKLPSDLGMPLMYVGHVWRNEKRFRADFRYTRHDFGTKVAKNSQCSYAVDGGKVYSFNGASVAVGMLRVCDIDTPEAADIMMSIETTFFKPLDALWSGGGGVAFMEVLQQFGNETVPCKSPTLPGGYSFLISLNDGSETTRLDFEPTKNHPFGYSHTSVRQGDRLFKVQRRVFSIAKEGILFPTRIVEVASFGTDDGYTRVVMFDLEPLQADSPITRDISPASFRDFEVGYQVYKVRKSKEVELAEQY